MVFLGFWIALTVVNLIMFDLFWILLTGFCGGLTGLNVVSFFKCKGEHQAQLKYLKRKFGLRMFETSSENNDGVKII